MLERCQAVIFVDSDESVGESESLRSEDIRSGMCAPILRGQSIVGFTQVDCRGDSLGLFARHDLEIFAVLTHQFSLADNNLQLTQVLRDAVDDLKQTQAEMQQLAFYDVLTGLPNRRLFMDRLEQAVHTAKRSHKGACLLYLDLDQFKHVNDTLGHDTGDALLKEISHRFRACVRSDDTVARIGGDEFAIVLSNVESGNAVKTVCEKLLSRLHQPVKIHGHEIGITTSIGIAMSAGDGTNATTLLKNADIALYKAKSRGRNNYQFFTEKMNAELSERISLESELRNASSRGELVQHYQPLYTLNNSSLVGVEALIRWYHPQRSVILPTEFIWLAEETKLINTVGEWALRAACTEVATAKHIEWLKLSVNLAARQLTDKGLLEVVERALQDSGLAADRLTLEITESMLMHVSDVLPNLLKLKDIGVSLAIDDFGTGYSSLNYLKKLPVDILKLDRTFVTGIPAEQRDTNIASAVIAMAHELKMVVVAEGIESEAQLAFLRDNGCHVGQGFLLGRPSSYADATSRLHI